MKAAGVREIKSSLNEQSPKELTELVLRLAKFKKENKELLTYLLYEAHDEDGYITQIKEEIDWAFEELNTSNFYLIKKGVRKCLRTTKKLIRFSGQKETEVQALLHFCTMLKNTTPSMNRSRILQNVFDTQLRIAEKKLASLHEDLQFDYQSEIDRLKYD